MRLIDADAACEKCWAKEVGECSDECILFMDGRPTIDVAPVVHGRWVWELADNGWANWMCTKCGYTRNVDVHVVMDWNYCPHCGARMDGE